MNNQELLTLTELFKLLVPHKPLQKVKYNRTNYLKWLEKLGVKPVAVGKSKSGKRRLLLYDISGVKWEFNKITKEDYMRNPGRFIRYSEWVRRYSVSPYLRAKLIKRKAIPYVRLGKKLILVPTDFDPYAIAAEEHKEHLRRLEQEIHNLAQGNLQVLVFPDWKKYPMTARSIARYFLAAERRLLKVAHTHAVWVSLIYPTLDEIVEKEGLEGLIYYIKHRSEQNLYKKALERKEVEIVDCFKLRKPFPFALPPGKSPSR